MFRPETGDSFRSHRRCDLALRAEDLSLSSRRSRVRLPSGAFAASPANAGSEVKGRGESVTAQPLSSPSMHRPGRSYPSLEQAAAPMPVMACWQNLPAPLRRLSFPSCNHRNTATEDTMASAHDVAAYITQKRGEMSAMKLFRSSFTTRRRGISSGRKSALSRTESRPGQTGRLFPRFTGSIEGSSASKAWSKGDAKKLSNKQVESVDAVLKFYAPKSAHYLSDLTHSEAPWKDAREGPPSGRSKLQRDHSGRNGRVLRLSLARCAS